MNTDINSAWNQHLFQLSWFWCFIFGRQTGVYPLYEIADKEVCNLLQRDAAIPLGISKFMQLRFPHYTLQNFISLYHTSLTRNFFYFTNKNEWLWKLDRTSRFHAVPCYITLLWSYETTLTRRKYSSYQFHHWGGPKPPWWGSNPTSRGIKPKKKKFYFFKFWMRYSSSVKRIRVQVYRQIFLRNMLIYSNVDQAANRLSRVICKQIFLS